MFSFVWPIDDSGKPFTLQTREPAIIEKRKARQSLIHNIQDIDKMENDVKGTSLYEDTLDFTDVQSRFKPELDIDNISHC